MNNVTIIKGDLFSAPEGSIICHACNCQGVWGSGIAKQFAKRYPEAYKVYQKICESPAALLRGQCALIETERYEIGCLFTSAGYGSKVDAEREILTNTWYAINDLLLKNIHDKPIYMCKINSGLFGVPWELTEKVLQTFEEQDFIVYEF